MASPLGRHQPLRWRSGTAGKVPLGVAPEVHHHRLLTATGCSAAELQGNDDSPRLRPLRKRVFASDSVCGRSRAAAAVALDGTGLGASRPHTRAYDLSQAARAFAIKKVGPICAEALAAIVPPQGLTGSL